MGGMKVPPDPSADIMNVFDRGLVRRRRDRAAARFHDHDFLVREVADRLADRLADVKRNFATVLDLGCHTGQMAEALRHREDLQTLVQADLSPGMAARASGLSVAADEELLPFAEGRFDLVTSCLSLHWVNDLPGALVQIRNTLNPDGLFLGAMLGADTLFELRGSLMEAELDATGGVSPRLSPVADLRDAGGLLQRAGFALPVIDSDVLTVTYPDALALMRDLRGMGETNAVHARSRAMARRDVLVGAAARYAARHAEPDGRITATFQVIYLTGWAPHESQQRPLRPGSAGRRLADALDTSELPAGDKAAPRRGSEGPQ